MSPEIVYYVVVNALKIYLHNHMKMFAFYENIWAIVYYTVSGDVGSR